MNINTKQEEAIKSHARKVINHIMTKYGLEYEEKIVYKGLRKVDSQQVYKELENKFEKSYIGKKFENGWFQKKTDYIFNAMTSNYKLELKDIRQSKKSLLEKKDCGPWSFDYYENVFYYQVPKVIYWRIYRKFEERLDILNIDLNKISITKLKQRLISQNLTSDFAFERERKSYMEYLNYLKFTECKETEAQTKLIAFKLWEYEALDKLNKYLIDYLLSPDQKRS